MANEWTLESELCKLTGSSGLAEALASLGLLQSPTVEFDIRQSSSWQRGGAETFIYRFWITTEGKKHERGYILKACAPFSSGIDIKDIFISWLARRELLTEFGASTPLLVTCSTSTSILIEELIPFSISEALCRGRESHRQLSYALTKIAAIYSTLGFSPIDGFGDLRSRGSDAVIIDFGEDLGPPSLQPPNDRYAFNALLAQMVKWNFNLDANLVFEIEKQFDEILQITKGIATTQDRRV